MRVKQSEMVKKSSGDDKTVLFPDDLTLAESEFPRDGAATEKVLVPMLVSTLGTKSG